jgi:hypothetical protein
MVIALSQFIAYLLIHIVGEKENKIKEGMKIMGLRDSVFWCVNSAGFCLISLFKLNTQLFLTRMPGRSRRFISSPNISASCSVSSRGCFLMGKVAGT